MFGPENGFNPEEIKFSAQPAPAEHTVPESEAAPTQDQKQAERRQYNEELNNTLREMEELNKRMFEVGEIIKVLEHCESPAIKKILETGFISALLVKSPHVREALEQVPEEKKIYTTSPSGEKRFSRHLTLESLGMDFLKPLSNVVISGGLVAEHADSLLIGLKAGWVAPEYGRGMQDHLKNINSQDLIKPLKEFRSEN